MTRLGRARVGMTTKVPMTPPYLLMAVGSLLLGFAMWPGPPELAPVGMLSLFAGLVWWARQRSGIGRQGPPEPEDWGEEAPERALVSEDAFSGGGGAFGGAGASEHWAEVGIARKIGQKKKGPEGPRGRSCHPFRFQPLFFIYHVRQVRATPKQR